MPAAIFARLCLVEARRGGLPWLAAACVLAALAFAAFLSQLAITEARALQVAALAAVLRASLAFMVAAHVTASTLREICSTSCTTVNFRCPRRSQRATCAMACSTERIY